MSFTSFLKSLLAKQTKSTKRKRSSSDQNKFSFETLETRNLLAGVHFDAAEGILRVTGNSADNVGEVQQLNATTVRASLDSYASVDVNTADVDQIIFLGFGGDDHFTNNTGIEGLILGFNGNDTLIGGSGFDQISGGAGNDVIYGNDGNDKLLGVVGNDTLYGGNGNDSMFAGSGTNTMHGESGDDIMFGGDGVDTIFGNSGIDQIFGLAGDDILNGGAGGVAGSTGISQADLVLGLDGNDTISASTGLNVLYGGNGDDTFIGGSGENRMHGQNGDDTMTGGASNDYIAGNLDNDTINGAAGNDYILPGFGDDSVSGGSGSDFVVLNGVVDDFMIKGSGTSLELQDFYDIAGSDQVDLAEQLRFDDGDQAAVSRVSKSLTIQPIIVSNTDGSNTAEYFGNADQESEIKRKAEFILYQAGVDLDWLTENTLNNTFVNIGNSNYRSTNDLDTIISIGDGANVSHANSQVLNVYFVEKAAGFNDTGENVANGLAYIDHNGVSIAIGDNLVGFTGGRDVIASVFAHELGHNLGLGHVAGSSNLMSESGSSSALNSSQISTVLNSQYTLDI